MGPAILSAVALCLMLPSSILTKSLCAMCPCAMRLVLLDQDGLWPSLIRLSVRRVDQAHRGFKALCTKELDKACLGSL